MPLTTGKRGSSSASPSCSSSAFATYITIGDHGNGVYAAEQLAHLTIGASNTRIAEPAAQRPSGQ